MSTFVLNRGYALQLPTNYVEVDKDEMEYVDGAGWLAWECAYLGGIAGAIAGSIATAAALGLASSYIPVLGTLTGATIGLLAGAAFGFLQGWSSGYTFGRQIENKLHDRLGWNF